MIIVHERSGSLFCPHLWVNVHYFRLKTTSLCCLPCFFNVFPKKKDMLTTVQYMDDTLDEEDVLTIFGGRGSTNLCRSCS